MSHTLVEIAQQLKDANEKVQLIYAFNGTGKTRLSREFKDLIVPDNDVEEDFEAEEDALHKILYYNAFTEDLFYWDNDLEFDIDPKLKIQPNSFTSWILLDQGQDRNIATTFQRYSDPNLTPHFSEDLTEVTFTLERGDDERSGNLKLSKGEESNFIWSIFYTLLEEVISVLNVSEESHRQSNDFDQLEYVFIDDPVSSLDENHLIQQAVDLAQLVKKSTSNVKFIVTTHNPLFYNVLHNEFKKNKFLKYFFKRLKDGTYVLEKQRDDSPFSYHLHLKKELENALESGQVSKYHFNFLRNILEKTATFLGYQEWKDILPPTNEGSVSNPYASRIINISSHSKHASEEVAELTEDDKRVLRYLVNDINSRYHFKLDNSQRNSV